MDKIICDVCGTSYAENTSQCPICGLARPSKPKAAPSAESDSGSYTYVKGGRFSSGNVRKRNADRGITTSFFRLVNASQSWGETWSSWAWET